MQLSSSSADAPLLYAQIHVIASLATLQKANLFHTVSSSLLRAAASTRSRILAAFRYHTVANRIPFLEFTSSFRR